MEGDCTRCELHAIEGATSLRDRPISISGLYWSVDFAMMSGLIQKSCSEIGLLGEEICKFTIRGVYDGEVRSMFGMHLSVDA